MNTTINVERGEELIDLEVEGTQIPDSNDPEERGYEWEIVATTPDGAEEILSDAERAYAIRELESAVESMIEEQNRELGAERWHDRNS